MIILTGLPSTGATASKIMSKVIKVSLVLFDSIFLPLNVESVVKWNSIKTSQPLKKVKLICADYNTGVEFRKVRDDSADKYFLPVQSRP